MLTDLMNDLCMIKTHAPDCTEKGCLLFNFIAFMPI